MIKRTLLSISLVLIAITSNAQNSRPVYELYLDFNEHLLGNQTKALEVAQHIISSPEKLPEKQQTNFYYKLASIYENTNQDEKAIAFYSKVILAEPEFYVPHRALGYLYLKEANPVVNKINSAKGNKEAYTKYLDQYKAIIKKAIPHLEKATACDPNEETLNLVKSLYQRINDASSVSTLDARLKRMGENCITILTD